MSVMFDLNSPTMEVALTKGGGCQDGKWCPQAHCREFEYPLRVLVLVNQKLRIGPWVGPKIFY